MTMFVHACTRLCAHVSMHMVSTHEHVQATRKCAKDQVSGAGGSAKSAIVIPLDDYGTSDCAVTPK